MHFRFKKCGPFFGAAIIFATIACYAPSANAQDSETNFLGANEAAMLKMMAGMAIKPTGGIDQDFVAMMVPHHQGAIDMAQAELLYGHNQQLLRISQEIVVEQEQEIAAMRLAIGEPASPSWAIEAAPKSAKTSVPAESFSRAAERPYLQQTDAAMDKMMTDMAVKPTGDVDHDFVAMMVPHHQGAIDMAQAELRYGSNPQLKTIAQEIIVDQMQEITLMRLAVGEPLPSNQPAPTQPHTPGSASQSSGSGATQMQMSPNMNMAPAIKGSAH